MKDVSPCGAARATASPSISIALATFDGARFLERQLETLAAQTRVPFELVVNDDGSTDRTVAIVEEFGRRAPFPVRLERNTVRVGWRGNFVAAACRTRGDLVAFCDQDDLWHEDKLATVAPHFDDPEVLLVFHDADLVDADDRPIGTLSALESSVRRIPRLERPTPWSNPLGLVQVFRRELLRFAELWPDSVDLAAPAHRAAHDQWFYRWATNLGDVVALPDRLLGYRQHDANAVGWSARKPSMSARRRTVDELERVARMLGAFVTALGTATAREREHGMRARLERASECNRQLLDRVEQRLAIYRMRGAFRRAAAVARLASAGAYTGPGWTLGRRALVTDAVTGVLFGAPEARPTEDEVRASGAG